MRGIIHFIGLVFLGLLSIDALAGAQPKFSFFVIERGQPVITSDGATQVIYQVTNNTRITRTLVMVPRPGLALVAGLPGKCDAPFTLAPGQSCQLHIIVVGSEIGSGVSGGPVVCKTYLPNSTIPDTSLCSQPASGDTLNIRVVG